MPPPKEVRRERYARVIKVPSFAYSTVGKRKVRGNTIEDFIHKCIVAAVWLNRSIRTVTVIEAALGEIPADVTDDV